MSYTVDTIVLFASVILLGISLITAYLVFTRGAERRRVGQPTAETAIKCLQEWRDSGVLVIAEEDFQLALELERRKPGQLLYLVRTIRRILRQKDLEPNTALLLTVRVEYESKPENMSKQDPSTGHLELITEFA